MSGVGLGDDGMLGGRYPDLPKVLNSGIYPKSYLESLYDLGYIAELRTFGSSG